MFVETMLLVTRLMVLVTVNLVGAVSIVTNRAPTDDTVLVVKIPAIAHHSVRIFS